jgi:hypothetical protein
MIQILLNAKQRAKRAAESMENLTEMGIMKVSVVGCPMSAF